MAEHNLHQRRPAAAANGGGGTPYSGGYGGAYGGTAAAGGGPSPYYGGSGAGGGASPYGAAAPGSGGYAGGGYGGGAATPQQPAQGGGGYTGYPQQQYMGGTPLGAEPTSSSNPYKSSSSTNYNSNTKRRSTSSSFPVGGSAGSSAVMTWFMGILFLLLLIFGFVYSSYQTSTITKQIDRVTKEKQRIQRNLDRVQRQYDEKHREYDDRRKELDVAKSDKRKREEELTKMRNAAADGSGDGGGGMGMIADHPMISELEDENFELQAELEELRDELADHQEHDHDHEHLQILAEETGQQPLHEEHVEEVLKNTSEQIEEMKLGAMSMEERLGYRLNLLRKFVQLDARREVEEKFGPGPHYVKLFIQYAEDYGKPPNPLKYLKLEMAPLDLMPHAVHLFLEQVTHGLWDGCSFVINAKHVLQASAVPPTSMVGQPAQDMLGPFRDKQLATVSFQEYHPSFPHREYTLGYAGRPGGPDFYINLFNNAKAHGPGGQIHHDIEEEADPCFAKVVDGFQTLEEMKKRKTSDKNLLIQRIGIVKAEVMGYKKRQRMNEGIPGGGGIGVGGVAGGSNDPNRRMEEVGVDGGSGGRRMDGAGGAAAVPQDSHPDLLYQQNNGGGGGQQRRQAGGTGGGGGRVEPMEQREEDPARHYDEYHEEGRHARRQPRRKDVYGVYGN